MEYLKKPDFRGGEQEEFCCAQRILKETRMKDSSEDFILPDYLPDIKKIVAVFRNPTLKSRFLSSGTLEYEGEVRYKLLYIGEEHTLHSVTFLTAFDDKVGNEKISEETVDIIYPKAEGVTVRLLNPRKVNIRSQNGAEISLYLRKNHRPELYGALTFDDEEKLETKCCTVPSANVMNYRETGLTLSEDLNFDSTMPTAKELILGTVSFMAEESHVKEGEAQIRGSAEVCCLFSKEHPGETEEFFFFKKSVPFTQTLKSKDFHENGECFAWLLSEGTEFRLREDEFGQKRVVEFDMTYLADLTVFYNKETVICKDAFSTEKEVENSFSEKEFYFVPQKLKGGFSVSESMSLDLPEQGGYQLVGCFAEPSLHLAKESDEKGGRAILEGECVFSLLLKDSSGMPDERRTTLPLKFRLDRQYAEGAEGFVLAKVLGMRTRLDQNMLTCDFEMVYQALLVEKTEEMTLDTLKLLKEDRKNGLEKGSLVLYYKEDSEDLFDIAKKYKVPLSRLNEENKNRKEQAPLRIPACK